MRGIYIFSANEIKSSESFSNQPTQLIVQVIIGSDNWLISVYCVLNNNLMWALRFRYIIRGDSLKKDWWKKASVSLNKVNRANYYLIWSNHKWYRNKTINAGNAEIIILPVKIDRKNSWFYLLKVSFPGHFLPCTNRAPRCSWNFFIRTWSKPNLIIENWFWVQWCAPAKI